MHYNTIIIITSKNVWNNFAECIRKNTLIKVSDGFMYISF